MKANIHETDMELPLIEYTITTVQRLVQYLYTGESCHAKISLNGLSRYSPLKIASLPAVGPFTTN